MAYDLEKLKKHLESIMQDKSEEIAMASVVGINCKIPEEISGFLTDFLNLETVEEDALNELFTLTPDQITIVATLAMIANGRVADFCRLERNMVVLKLSTVDYLQDDPDYRETSVDENEGNPQAVLDAMIKIRKMFKSAMQNKKNNNE